MQYFASLKLDLGNVMVVTPDAGGVKMGRAFAKRLGVDLAFVDKRRTAHDRSEVVNLSGDVEGHDCILLDDMISTAGTISQAAIALKAAGAKRVIACATHGVFSGPAFERLAKAPIDEVAVTNTLPVRQEGRPDKVRVLDISKLLSKAILNIHAEESVSSLFI
jgi:ribose-phosphate pyrophosphokinase